MSLLTDPKPWQELPNWSAKWQPGAPRDVPPTLFVFRVLTIVSSGPGRELRRLTDERN